MGFTWGRFTLMFKFFMGVIVGMFICENYDYTFTGLLDYLEEVFIKKD